MLGGTAMPACRSKERKSGVWSIADVLVFPRRRPLKPINQVSSRFSISIYLEDVTRAHSSNRISIKSTPTKISEGAHLRICQYLSLSALRQRVYSSRLFISSHLA